MFVENFFNQNKPNLTLAQSAFAAWLFFSRLFSRLYYFGRYHLPSFAKQSFLWNLISIIGQSFMKFWYCTSIYENLLRHLTVCDWVRQWKPKAHKLLIRVLWKASKKIVQSPIMILALKDFLYRSNNKINP